MLRIGLTGGIGAGKSTVARELERLGAVVVDADAIAREVVAPGTAGLAAVVEEFGEEVRTADGALDRPALGRIVFADPVARARLEEITHPLIAAETARRVAGLPSGTVVVHDVPLIVERGLADRYDLVAVVGADADVRLERLVRDRGMSREDALARIGAQATDAERRAVADVWLDNVGRPEDLLAEVRRLWHERLLPEARAR